MIILDSFIRYFLFILLIVIVIWIIKQLLDTTISMKMAKWKHRLRFRQSRKASIESGQERSKIARHISFLLQVTLKRHFELAVPFFMIVTGLLFFSTFILMFSNTYDVVLSALIGSFVGLLPYMILQVRLRVIRTVISNHLLSVVQMITQNYSANGQSVYQTMLITRDQIEDSTFQAIFTVLVNDMQVSRMEHDLQESMNLFIYSSGTTWAKQLGNILLKGFIADENIQNALLNLSSKMEQTESMLEEEMSESYEPRIGGYLTLPIFIASILLGWYVTGPQDWYYLQFEEHYAFITFSLALTLTIISVFLSMLMSQPKNDM